MMGTSKKRLDLTVDAPPDLAIEVDVTRSSLDRLQVYARLGVAEGGAEEGAAPPGAYTCC